MKLPIKVGNKTMQKKQIRLLVTIEIPIDYKFKDFNDLLLKAAENSDKVGDGIITNIQLCKLSDREILAEVNNLIAETIDGYSGFLYEKGHIEAFEMVKTFITNNYNK